MPLEKPEAFFLRYLTGLPEDHPHHARTIPPAWGFGDSPEMADELGRLVVQGVKTATASLLWEYEHEGEQVPEPGDLSIVLGGGGEPLCLIETLEVRVLPFDQVEAQFAYDEGEGDRTLDFWRSAHWRFFGRTCTAIGRTPSPDMPVVCERFWMLCKASL